MPLAEPPEVLAAALSNHDAFQRICLSRWSPMFYDIFVSCVSFSESLVKTLQCSDLSRLQALAASGALSQESATCRACRELARSSFRA